MKTQSNSLQQSQKKGRQFRQDTLSVRYSCLQWPFDSVSHQIGQLNVFIYRYDSLKTSIWFIHQYNQLNQSNEVITHTHTHRGYRTLQLLLVIQSTNYIKIYTDCVWSSHVFKQILLQLHDTRAIIYRKSAHHTTLMRVYVKPYASSARKRWVKEYLVISITSFKRQSPNSCSNH